METAMLPNLALGDKRLDKRCNQIIDQFVKKPTMSIPEACGNWKSTKAAYRFFTNDSVEADKILQAHYRQTRQKIKETDDMVLVAQDTTDIDYNASENTRARLFTRRASFLDKNSQWPGNKRNWCSSGTSNAEAVDTGYFNIWENVE